MSKLQDVADLTERGKSKQIGAAVQEALDEGNEPVAILNTMIDVMGIVGEKFKKKEVFVPEMMLAARAMKMGVEVLKPHLAGDNTVSAGKLVIGTVAGDMHDIGKNLVAMMMESSGFEVIDLGVDVPVDKFVAAVKENSNVKIVCLSALLTTAMKSMRDTVAALAAEDFRAEIKIMVGGAPVTQAFADEIGADAYTADAASAAQKAKELVA